MIDAEGRRSWGGGRYQETKSRALTEAADDAFVTEASDAARARRVALRGARIVDAEARGHVLVNAREAAALDHPNVAATYEAFVDGEWLLVAREWIDGARIDDAMRTADRATKVQALSDVAAALSAAHRRGVVHGALGVENVFVHRDGSVKVADFAGTVSDASAEDDVRAWVALARTIFGDDAPAALEVERGGAATFDTLLQHLHEAPGARQSAVARSSRTKRIPRGALILGASCVAVPTAVILIGRNFDREAPEDIAATSSQSIPRAASSDAPLTTAMSLYRAAMQSARDASMGQARAQMDQAIEAEPTFAAAHLRRALFSYGLDADVREHFAQAFEPCMQVEPQPAVSVERLERATASQPDDPELHYMLGVARWFAGDLVGAIRDLSAAYALDAGFVETLRFGAFLRTLQGDPSAPETYRQCIERSPAATSCMRGLAQLEIRHGHCAEAQTLARRILAVEPNSASAYGTLAQSLEALGSPEESVRDALERQVAMVAESSREITRQDLRTRYAILHGDFDAAIAAIHAWQAALAPSSDEWEQLTPIDFAVDVLVETGRGDEATRVATTFLRSRSGWVSKPGSDASEVVLASSLYRAGALSRHDLASTRDRWLANERSARPILGGTPMQEAWTLAYGINVVTKQDALDALEAFKTLPEPALVARDPLFFDAYLGLAHLASGDAAGALSYLERATQSCGELDQPIVHTWALSALGNALEATGDVRGACDAYARVLARWGKSKARTAVDARKRSRAISCRR